MMNEEEKEIFNNLKEYMQQRIDKGYHKFIYNDLDWDFKCIDCINALNKAIELQKELDKSNERIDMCIDLLNGEGCLNFDTKQEKLDYIDKLIKLEVEDEQK